MRVEPEPAAEQSHIRGTIRASVADVGGVGGGGMRIDPGGQMRVAAAQGEAGRRRQQHEIAGFQRNRRMVIDAQQASPFQHHAETGLAELGVVDRPGPGAADALGEHRTGPEQADDVGERVVHGRTMAKQNRTLSHG